MVPLGHVSIDKLNELGLKYQPIEETINDVVSSLKRVWVVWLEGSEWSIGSMLRQPIIANLMKIFYILKQVCFISYIYEVSQKVHKTFYRNESTSFVLSFVIHVFN